MDKVNNLNNILRSFKIKAECIDHRKVRHISFYDVRLQPGTRMKELDRFTIEISLALKSRSQPIIRPIVHEGIIRLEIVDDKPEKIDFFSEFKKMEVRTGRDERVPVFLGSSVDGENMWTDMSRNPHMIVAGCTGSGKSTLLHTMLANFALLSNTVIHVIDTKNIEFSIYGDSVKNLVIHDSYASGLYILRFLYEEMERRYDEMRRLGVANAAKANLSNIILMIDEYADLIMQDSKSEFANLLCKLAQKCRAANIYCIIATQRPSADIISGSIKANFPARIACQVASGIDSKVVLDRTGAEKLSGMGDAIIKNYNNDYTRFQIAYSTPEEIKVKYAS
jgi:DNA segregation ATPase FtsK/SpoIIIE, S-DNA-T family